jgi:hypothetical protein
VPLAVTASLVTLRCTRGDDDSVLCVQRNTCGQHLLWRGTGLAISNWPGYQFSPAVPV